MENKLKYFNHVTVDTGHTRKSFRKEVGEDVIELMCEWFLRMKNKEVINIYDNYFCKLLNSNSKSADLMILNKSEHDSLEKPVLRFSICLHSRESIKMWQVVDGTGEPPSSPFIAVKFINPLLLEPALADFQRCLAWGFLGKKSNS